VPSLLFCEIASPGPLKVLHILQWIASIYSFDVSDTSLFACLKFLAPNSAGTHLVVGNKGQIASIPRCFSMYPPNKNILKHLSWKGTILKGHLIFHPSVFRGTVSFQVCIPAPSKGCQRNPKQCWIDTLLGTNLAPLWKCWCIYVYYIYMMTSSHLLTTEAPKSTRRLLPRRSDEKHILDVIKSMQNRRCLGTKQCHLKLKINP